MTATVTAITIFAAIAVAVVDAQWKKTLMALSDGVTMRQRHFFMMQVIDSMATNGSVHMDTCISDLNDEVIFDTVPDAPCEWSLMCEL